MEKNNLFLVLNSSVFITKGATRSTIIYENNYEFIPNDLYDVLLRYNNFKIIDIYKKFDESNHQILSEYLDYLLNKNYILFVKNPNSYPMINTDWDSTFEITNSIIDFSSNLNYKSVISSLSSLGCNTIQFRFFEIVKLSNIENVLKDIENSRIKSIEFIIKSCEYISDNDISILHTNYAKLTSVYMCDSKYEKTLYADKSNLRSIVYTKSKILNEISCGIIHPNYFATNLNIIREGINHNTCLNRKVSIDGNGDIKNCPSMKESFGNIKNTTIEMALNESNFKKYWNIKKDDIAVCKDCEFRNICTDCRAYIENPADIYSKPLKCGYSPYTNEWEEWSTNSLKQKAIKNYDMQDLVIKN